MEFALRAFLLKYHESQEPQADISTIVAGDEVPLNSFTNYDTLGMLIKSFNNVIRVSYPNYSVDETVVEVRDMIAHGRVAGDTPKSPLRLIKFAKPNSNKLVLVEHVVTVDSHWLSSNVNLVLEQVHKVVAASNKLGQNIMSYD